ncbi:MAG TPA: phage tail tape measure protein, partial [Coriobacteriia bacterium]|nr:phage tail tape measure protein [Coriobacteriia bacterium]
YRTFAALAVIFGSDAVRAANVLYDEGAAGIEEWTAAVDDSGYAAETAAIRLDNLKGDLEQLSGSIETALITAGESADGPLRFLVQGATDFVNAISEAPSAVQGVTLALLGGGGLVLLGVAGIGKLAVAIREAKVAMAALGWTTKGTALAATGVGAALGLAALGVMAWANNAAAAKARTEELQATLDEFGKTTDETLSTINDALSSNQNDWAEGLFGKDPESLIDQADKYGLSIEDLQGYILGEADAVDRVNAATGEYYRSHKRLNTVSTGIQAFTGALDDQAGALTGAEKAAAQKAAADEAAGVAQGDLADAYDVTTEAGRANQAALDGIAASGHDVQESMQATGALQPELQAAMQVSRDAFVN